MSASLRSVQPLSEKVLNEIAARSNRSPAELKAELARVQRLSEKLTKEVWATEAGVHRKYRVTRHSVGTLNRPKGKLPAIYFGVNDQWKDYIAIVNAPLDKHGMPIFNPSEPLPVRIDSGCTTAHYGDQECDCHGQLDAALDRIQRDKAGVVITIPRQGGRGYGTKTELAVLELQDKLGLSTLDAAMLYLGKEDLRDLDVRTWGGAIAVLKCLGVQPGQKILLMANNPEKKRIFEENAYSVETTSVVVRPATPTAAKHMQAKADMLDHRALGELSFQGGMAEDPLKSERRDAT